MKTLGDRLKEAMALAGVPSQAELSRLARLRPNTITRWIHGTTASPRENDLGVVCSVLKVRPEWLLFGVEPMKEDSAEKSAGRKLSELPDATLLGQCYTVVLETLEQRGTARPPAAKIGAVIAEVYGLCQREGKQPTQDLVAPFLRVLLA